MSLPSSDSEEAAGVGIQVPHCTTLVLYPSHITAVITSSANPFTRPQFLLPTPAGQAAPSALSPSPASASFMPSSPEDHLSPFLKANPIPRSSLLLLPFFL